MKIYTRTGDRGETGLLDGSRVVKSNPRVEAYGDVDELGAWLGAVRAGGIDTDIQAMLERSILLPPSAFESAFLSDAHTETEIDRTLEAADEATEGVV